MRRMDLGSIFGGIDAGDVQDVLKLVTDNKELIAQLGRLPELLTGLAQGLQSAGSEAGNAAVALVGDDGASGARGALSGAATSLTSIVASLGKGIDLVEQAAAAAAKVPLMDGPAQSLAGAAKELNGANASLGELAGSMATIAEVLGTVGAALKALGGYLDDSGAQAHAFVAAG